MNVATYLRTSKKSVTEVARAIGCSKGHISDLANGRRKPGKKTALKLERLTGEPWWKWVERA